MRVALADRARELRSDSTGAELVLWHAVRDRRLLGFKFRRQVPRSRYVTDFLCASAKLIVEVDGGQHALRSEEDNVRTQQLEKDGYRVLRFWNNEVLGNLEGVLTVIAAELANYDPSPRPSPRRGEGEHRAERGNRGSSGARQHLPLTPTRSPAGRGGAPSGKR